MAMMNFFWGGRGNADSIWTGMGLMDGMDTMISHFKFEISKGLWRAGKYVSLPLIRGVQMKAAFP
jgi:hypothetical protein